jgi:hypothetical protein
MTRSKLWTSVDGMRRAREVVIERSGGQCEARFSNHCTGIGTQAHHIILRSQGGTWNPANLAWVCAFCHSDIHENPARAKAYGLLASGKVDTMDLGE